MAVELATAYVSISASAGGIGRSITKELGGAEQAVGSSSSRMSSALTGAFRGVAGAVVGIGATIAGLALGGGINRALAIDNAQSKLKSLGYSTDQIASVMQSSLDSVKGTMFGLGDAASLASQLIAAGVRPGQDLSRALGLTADMAAVANVNLGDLTPVMGQLASSGRLYTQDLLQLQDRGLPVFSWLAESLGTTTDNVRLMVSNGDVSFAQLETAIQQHVGGAAKHTDSFKASLENVKAALSRFGAAIATPAMGMLKGIFLAAIPAVDALTAKMQPIVDSLTLRLGPIVDSLSAKMKTVFDGNAFAGLSGLAPILAPLAGMIAAVGSSSIGGAIPMLGNILPKISGPIGAIAGFVGEMLTNSPALRAALGNTFSTLGQVLQTLAPVFATLAPLIGSLAETVGNLLADAINQVLPIVVQLATMLGPILTQVIGALLPIIRLVVGIIETLTPVIGQVLAAVMPVIAALMPLVSLILSLVGPLVSLLAPVLEWVANLLVSILVPAIGWLSNALVTVIGWVMQAVNWLGAGGLGGAANGVGASIMAALQPLINWFTTYVSPALAAAGEFFALLWSKISSGLHLSEVFTIIGAAWGILWAGIQAVWTTVGSLIGIAISVAWQTIGGVLGGVWQSLVAVFSGIWEQIKIIAQTVLQVITGIFRAGTAILNGDWSGAWNAISGVFSSVTNGILATGRNIVNTLVGVFGGVQTQVMAVMGGIGSWLYNSGRSIIQGLIDGINSMLRAAMNSVGDVLAAIRKLFPFSPAEEGPFSGKGWTLYSGQAISKALGEGMLSAQSVPVSAARKMAAATRSALDIGTNPSISGSASPNTAPESASPSFDYDRLAAAMARVQIGLDGRVVSTSVDQRIGGLLR